VPRKGARRASLMQPVWVVCVQLARVCAGFTASAPGDDPAALIESTLAEMQGALQQGQKELVTTLGTAKRLEGEAEAQRTETTRWEERATLAVRKGDDELARDALKQKARVTREHARLLEQAATARASADALRKTLDDLEARARDLEARKGALAAQVRVARTASSHEASGALSDLQRFGQRINALEAEVEVAGALGDTQKAELEARFRKLEQSTAHNAVEDELAALKRKVEGG
jgi:phage shock protein A